MKSRFMEILPIITTFWVLNQISCVTVLSSNHYTTGLISLVWIIWIGKLFICHDVATKNSCSVVWRITKELWCGDQLETLCSRYFLCVILEITTTDLFSNEVLMLCHLLLLLTKLFYIWIIKIEFLNIISWRIRNKIMVFTYPIYGQ